MLSKTIIKPYMVSFGMIAHTLEESIGQHHLLSHEFNEIPDDAGPI